MCLCNEFKSVGFDHVRHTRLELFEGHLNEILSHGLGPKIDELVLGLVELGVLQSSAGFKEPEHLSAGYRDLYSDFFVFWREATQHLIDSSTFTLEDQKYYAYLYERRRLDEGSFLSGAARYDHVLVDEFQDINPLDLALIKVLAGAKDQPPMGA